MRFLIVKIGALGDVCLALPAIGALQDVFPGVEVDWLVGSEAAAVLKKHPGLSHAWVVDSKTIFQKNWFEGLRVATEWRALMPRYDGILLLHRKWSYVGWLRMFLRAPIFRMSRGTRSWPRVTAVQVLPLQTHESLAIRKVVEAVVEHFDGGSEFQWKWDLSYLKSSKPELCDELKPYWVVHAGGGQNAGTVFALKQWPHWRTWLRSVADRFPTHWVLVGAPSEKQEFPIHPRIHDRVGQTNIAELVQLIRGAQGFLGVDSGPLHLADALGVPAIGLYGPTSERSWGLLSPKSRILRTTPDCSPCYQDDGKTPHCRYAHRCMVDLSEGQVTEAVLEEAKRLR